MKLNKEIKKMDLLDNNIIIPHDVLEKSTVYPETLNVTESRQYRERGLLHITDSAHEFFFFLEQEHVDLINLHTLSLFKADMVDKSIQTVLNNERLRDKFIALFDITSNEEKVITSTC